MWISAARLPPLINQNVFGIYDKSVSYSMYNSLIIWVLRKMIEMFTVSVSAEAYNLIM